MAAFDYTRNVLATLTVGATFASRTGKTYTVTSVCTKRVTVARSNGKTVNASRKAIERAAATLASGGSLKYQASVPNGGISYTVAVEAAVVGALGAFIARNDALRCYVAA